MNRIAVRREGRVRRLFRHHGNLGRLTGVLATSGRRLCRGLIGSVKRANAGFRD